MVVHKHFTIRGSSYSCVDELPEISAGDWHLPGSHRAAAFGPLYVGLHMGASFVNPAVTFRKLQHGTEAVFPFLAEFATALATHPATHCVYRNPEVCAISFLKGDIA